METTAAEPRRCPTCNRKLVRGPIEHLTVFRNRVHCSPGCAAKPCLAGCGRKMKPQQYEPPSHFRKRRYCSLACSAKGRHMLAAAGRGAEGMVQP